MGAKSMTTPRWLFAVCAPPFRVRSSVWLGLAQTGDPVASLPLAALLKDFDALKALQDVAFPAQYGRRAQTAML